MWLQAAASSDTGIHLTLGTGMAVLLGKVIFDKFRKNGAGRCRYDEEVLKDIRDGINKLVTIMEMRGKV